MLSTSRWLGTASASDVDGSLTGVLQAGPFRGFDREAVLGRRLPSTEARLQRRLRNIRAKRYGNLLPLEASNAPGRKKAIHTGDIYSSREKQLKLTVFRQWIPRCLRQRLCTCTWTIYWFRCWTSLDEQVLMLLRVRKISTSSIKSAVALTKYNRFRHDGQYGAELYAASHTKRFTFWLVPIFRGSGNRSWFGRDKIRHW